MQHLAIAGFLSALAVAHATAAAFALLLFSRRALGAGDPPASARASRAEASQEVLLFGLLGMGAAAHAGGLARAHALAGEADAAASALAFASLGRVAAAAVLVHFVLRYARVERPRWLIGIIYGLAGVFAAATPMGLVTRFGEARLVGAWIAGLPAPSVIAPPGPLGGALAIATVVAALSSLALLGRAFLRGRREAVAFIGMTLLAVAVIYDALRDLGVVVGPPLTPIGYAALVSGLIVTLLARFTELRSQLEGRARELEGRARELRDRARALSRSYEELRAAQDELVRKEQLAAVGELSAVVAHEVRNPLAIISNAVATLRRPGVAAEDRETLLGILDEETTRLNRLVGDLLRYARPVNVERQLVNLREQIERGMALAENRLDLSAELHEPEPVEKVWADPNLIRQVFDNLIDNAIQAMSGGGVLTVTLVNIELDGARGVEAQIQDTGEGMDTEVRARALDPFFTTRPSGTGLGLAIVARIVDAHGGVLRIKSKAGSGTVMHVFLPISSEGAPRRGGSDRPGPRTSDAPLPAELQKHFRRTR